MLSMIRNHSLREQREENLKAEIAAKETLLEDARSQAETAASMHATHMGELMDSIKALKDAKEAAEEDAKRAKEAANESDKRAKEAETRAESSEAKAVYAQAEWDKSQTALAKLQAEISEKIDAGKDELVDMSMYRVWERNQDIDLSFLKDEAERLLKIWKARLEEKELGSFATGGVVSEADYIGEVSSKALSKGQAALDAEIDALLSDALDAEEASTAPAQP